MAIKFLNSVNADSGVLYVDAANDRVGIGTTSPSDILSVNSSSTETILHLTNTSTGTATSDGLRIGLVGASAYFLLRENANMLFHTNNTERMRITSAGNVGIGTTSPARKLQIGDGTADDRIRVYFSDNTYTEQTGYGMEFSRPASYIRPLTDNINNLYIGQSTKTWATLQTDATSHSFNNNGSTLMYIASDGDVGIGTTSPTAKLDVSGKIQNNAVIESKSGGTSSYIAHSASTDTYIAIAGRVDSYPAPSANASSIVTTRDGGTYPFNSYGHLVISSRHDSSRDILFRTNNTDRMVIQGGGNVGIGTTSPAQKLEVSFAASVYGARFTRNDAAGSSLIEFANNAGVKSIVGYDAGTDAYRIGTPSSNYNLIVKQSGNVGIGTTSPAQKLHVEGSVLIDAFNAGNETGIFFRESFYNYNVSILAYDHNGGGVSPDGISINGYDGVSFSTGSNTRNERMRITQSGNVGIGTTSPSTKLEVSGVITATGGSSTNWNTAYGWGNHAAAGYLTSYTETQTLDDVTTLGSTTTNNISIGPNFLVGEGISTTPAYLQLGSGRTASGYAYIDFVGDTTYTDYGLRVIRYNGGANTASDIVHRGTGQFSIISIEAAPILFKTSATERMRIDSSGNVGIGTTTPNAMLHVTDSIQVDGGDTFGVDNAGHQIYMSSGGSGLGGEFGTGYARNLIKSDGSATIHIGDNTSLISRILLDAGSAGTSGYISLQTKQVERVRVTADGNVGIGTTSPSEKLDVGGNIQASGSRFIRAEYDSNHYMQLESNSSGGILKGLDGGTTTVLVRSYGDSYFNGGNFGIGETSIDAKLHMTTGGSGLVNQKFESQGSAAWRLGIPDSSTSFVFDNANDDLSSSKFSIDASGNVTAAGDVTAYSDARIKENVETLPNALESVKAMRGVTYNKIGEEKQSIGVIAQEVQAVLPQLVSEHKDEMLSVAYGNITAVLIEAIKEQQDIISQLEERIIDLENRF